MGRLSQCCTVWTEGEERKPSECSLKYTWAVTILWALASMLITFESVQSGHRVKRRMNYNYNSGCLFFY